MKITQNKVATLSYTLKNDDDEILDQADESNPFLYMHGVGGIIPGLEKALQDKQVGDSFHVSILPEDAYGIRDPKLTEEVPRSMFENISDEHLQPGAQFHAQTAQGTQIITIAGVEGDTVSIDANHPLAGETLHFDVAVNDIRDATEEEIAHGHPHAAGGCGSHGGESSGGCGGSDGGCGSGGCGSH